MPAFHSDPQEKAQLIESVEAIRAADRIRQGAYYFDGKMCSVGCTAHSWAAMQGRECDDHGDHGLYDEILGEGGEMLAHLQEKIFEGLPEDPAADWPRRFYAAIEPGADLSRVGWKFLRWLLTDKATFPSVGNPLVRDVIRGCAHVLVPLTKGLPVNEAEARAAASAAELAARDAAQASLYKEAWAAAAAAAAAWAVVEAPARAVVKARAAASAASAASAAAGESVAVVMADKLEALLREAGR